MRVWYGLKHPSKMFDFSIVTCTYKPSTGDRDLFSAIIVAFVNENGVKSIHSKHDVQSRDSYRQDVSRTRIEAMETLLADLEWRMQECLNTYGSLNLRILPSMPNADYFPETKLKRAPRVSILPSAVLNALLLMHSQADRKPWT